MLAHTHTAIPLGAGPSVYESACSVRYSARDGSAVAGRDYRPVSGEIKFRPGETSHIVRVKLLPPPPAHAAEQAAAALSAAVAQNAAAAQGAAAQGAATQAAAVQGTATAAPSGAADEGRASSATPTPARHPNAPRRTLATVSSPATSSAPHHSLATISSPAYPLPSASPTPATGSVASAAAAGAGGKASRTFALVLSEPHGGCAIQRGPGGATLRITVISSAGEKAAARERERGKSRASAPPSRAGSEVGGPVSVVGQKEGAEGAGEEKQRYPLKERWLRQFHDAICYPPPPAIDEDDGKDDQGEAEGAGTGAQITTAASGQLPVVNESSFVKGGGGGGQGNGEDGGEALQDEPEPPPAPEATKLGLAGHLLTVVFKFLLATIPPADYMSG